MKKIQQDISRRALIVSTFGIFAAACMPFDLGRVDASESLDFTGEDVFHRIVSRAKSDHWAALPIGELMGQVAHELIGVPYVAGTLDRSTKSETCSVNLQALDCVTFVEVTLGFARMLKGKSISPRALLEQVQYIRYRGGTLTSYTSRLHYTSDWFIDNETKGVIELLADLPGMEPFEQKVGFMSSHPDKYPQLVAHPEFIPIIKKQEEAINQRSIKFVPLEKIQGVEPLLKTGDIVGVCTSLPGLDIAHTGLVLRMGDTAHFIDASSRKNAMQVTIEPGPISKSLSWSKSLTGAIFARPLEPGRKSQN